MTTTPRDLPVLALTGATGALGGAVARLLAEAGVPQRLLVRDPSRAPALPGAVAVGLGAQGYADRGAAEAALAGVDVLLFVSAGEAEDRLAQHRTFVDAAAAAGVRHVVYTSFVGASPTCTFTLGRDHAATEEALRASGAAWTFLRDSFYADFLPDVVGEDGTVRGPAGDGRVAVVARADVAEVAARVLRDAVADPGAHAGASYDLTGPEAPTFTEVAALLTEVGGREVRFVDETEEEAYASRASYAAPPWQLDAWVSTYTAVRAGELAAVSGDVERLLGRPARTLRQVLGERFGRAG